MDEKKDWFFEEDNSDMLESVRRFEDMLDHKARYFFDVHELEDVIDYYLDMGDFNHAARAAKYAMNTYPGSESIQQRVCEILIDKGRPAEAVQILERLSGSADCDYEVYLLKGEALLQMDKTRESLRAFEKGYSISGEDKDSAAHRIGILLERSGQYLMALRYLEEARSLSSDDYMIYYDLAYCWEKLDDCKKSVLFYQKFLDEDPFSEHVWYNLGIAYGRLENYDKAIESYDFAIAINEHYASAYFNKANILAEKGLYEESILAYKEFIALESESAAAFCYIGENYEKLQDDEIALEFYRYAIRMDSTLAAAWLGLGMVTCRLESAAEGIQHIEKALELNPEYPEALLALARACVSLPDLSRALKVYQQLTRIEKEDPEIWIGYGDLLFQEQPDLAISTMEQACQTHPGSHMLHLRLAAYLLLSQRQDEGLSQLRRGWVSASSEERQSFLEDFPLFAEDPQIKQCLQEL